ncbi:MAG: hypothetical protein ABIS92_05265 [Polyangia bacterium]
MTIFWTPRLTIFSSDFVEDPPFVVAGEGALVTFLADVLAALLPASLGSGLLAFFRFTLLAGFLVVV